MPNRLKIIKIIHILLVLGMNSTQFQLIFSSKNLKNLRKSMTIQWHFFCWTMLNAKLRVRRSSFGVRSEFVGNRWFAFFSMKSMFLNNHQGNSRFDNYFRVFLGDCTDFQKITEILRIEQYFQVFAGDFNNFKKNHGKFKDWTVFSSFHRWL